MRELFIKFIPFRLVYILVVGYCFERRIKAICSEVVGKEGVGHGIPLESGQWCQSLETLYD